MSKKIRIKKRCLISGKPIDNKRELIIPEFAIDYVRKMGYKVTRINPKEENEYLNNMIRYAMFLLMVIFVSSHALAIQNNQILSNNFLNENLTINIGNSTGGGMDYTNLALTNQSNIYDSGTNQNVSDLTIRGECHGCIYNVGTFGQTKVSTDRYLKFSGLSATTSATWGYPPSTTGSIIGLACTYVAGNTGAGSGNIIMEARISGTPTINITRTLNPAALIASSETTIVDRGIWNYTQASEVNVYISHDGGGFAYNSNSEFWCWIKMQNDD